MPIVGHRDATSFLADWLVCVRLIRYSPFHVDAYLTDSKRNRFRRSKNRALTAERPVQGAPWNVRHDPHPVPDPTVAPMSTEPETRENDEKRNRTANSKDTGTRSNPGKHQGNDTFATEEVRSWCRGYLERHPVAALETVGRQVIMGREASRYLFSDLWHRRFPFREFVQQTAFMIKTSSLPTVAVALPISATLSIQFGLLAGQVGATSLAGAASGLAVIRQSAPMVTAILLAAAVGSAICADLGARTIRDEIDAMEVMGVSTVRRLVVPRVTAGIVVAMALTGLSCFVGFLAGYLFNVYVQDGTPGSFMATFSSFATAGDLYLAMVKAAVFGAIVTVIACEKGLHTRGGPSGVANSVNATVVAAIILLMLVNVGFTELYTILFPRTTL